MSFYRFNVASVQIVLFDNFEEHVVEWLIQNIRKGISRNKY